MAGVECLVEAKDTLSEGVIWHPEEQKLYWCDNLTSNIQTYDPATGAHESYFTG
tara:strand:- start:201 stop:362 length:162 start_codon:yes stop_codon:yes gene_type:complete